MRLTNLLVSVAAGPGIVAHEYAHYAACRLAGVEVRSPPALRPFDDSAVLEHEPVSDFGTDFAIAVAPFVGNSALAFGAFAVAGATAGLTSLLCLWLGACFGFTALPSRGDTHTLLATASELPSALRPLGYLLATPVRTATFSVWVGGLLAFGWTMVLLGGSGAVA